MSGHSTFLCHMGGGSTLSLRCPICKIEKIYSSNGYTNYKVSMIFNCKLYSVGLNGESKGEIKNGEITGLISVPY